MTDILERTSNRAGDRSRALPRPGAPALFLDRDGVLNFDLGYVTSIADLRWIPGAIRTVRTFSDAGWYVFVVSNQAAIARNYCREVDVIAPNAAMQRTVAAAGGRIAQFYYCPYHGVAVVPRYRVANHFDRKPNPGIILAAARDWQPDMSRSFLIGDRLSDLVAAAAAGIPGHMFRGIDLYDFCAENGLLP